VFLRSLRNRLALIFGLIVLGAIAIVSFSVTPQLESRLRDEKLHSMAKEAGRTKAQLKELVGGSPRDPRLNDRVREVAAKASAGVLVLGLPRRAGAAYFPVSDSTPTGGIELEDAVEVAEEAVRTRRTATAAEPTRLGRQALAATSLTTRDNVRYLVVLSDSFADVESTVSLIRRQILVSGAIALVIALVAGYLVARGVARRVQRLEHAARKVAAGDFSNPIKAESEDELGQLASAFDDMQRQLARLDSARKQFIASASHELRTPIFSLGGFLELLEDEDLDDATREQFMAQVRDQVERLRKLTTELLDLSRLESGALELRPEPTDIGQLAREVAGEFTPAVTRHGSRLELRVDGGSIETEVDPERVAQVLRILLDNALLHTPAGTGIVVSAARTDGHVRVEVTDTGLGIKRQTMPHIFEPFFTSNDDAQGAGLGLAIARELAERMRGELRVRSRPGRTTFSLLLPS
jgi:signal transduction histidine kinase